MTDLPRNFPREHRGKFPFDEVDDAGKFGRPWEHITPESKARADAEWAALDERGQLPEGWSWPEKEMDRG
jgi:hypothetical protein